MADQPGKVLGRWMLGGACVLGMAVLTLLFRTVEEHQRNPNMTPLSRSTDAHIEVVLDRNRQGHYIVSGTINDREVEFLLDTGASDVVVPFRLARALDLPFGRKGQAMTANGPTTTYRTNLARLRFGTIELRDVQASINTGAQSGAILLGMSALKQIEFSQRGNQLTLRQIQGQ